MSEGPPSGTPEGRQLPVRWVGAEDAPLLFVNQVLGQVGQQGEVVLTFGQLIPPAFFGTPEQIAEQAQDMTHVPVQTAARLVITREGLDQLIQVLGQTVENYEQARYLLEQMQSRADDEK